MFLIKIRVKIENIFRIRIYNIYFRRTKNKGKEAKRLAGQYLTSAGLEERYFRLLGY